MALLQNVINRGTHAARPTAGSAGILYYETDTGQLFRDSGSAWQLVDASGLFTTKGDLLAATGSGTVTRLAAGSDGQVLTADSTQSAGLKYATSSGLLAQVLLSTLASNISSASSTTKWTDLANPTVSITTSGSSHRLLCQLSGTISVASGEAAFAIKVNSTYYPLGGSASGSRVPLLGLAIDTPASSGAQTVGVSYYMASAGSWNCRPSSFPDNEEMRLLVSELTS